MSDQAYPAGGYPSMPAEPPSDPAVQGPPPPPVANAAKLMLLRAALNLLGLLVLLGTRSSLKDQIRNADPTLSPAELDTAVTTTIAAGLVFGIVFIALYVLLALQVRKGKNWARIVTWVLAGVSALSGLASLAQPIPGLSRILGLVTLLLDAAIIVLLALRPSSQYFHRTPHVSSA
jgi:hypothetical protein